MKHLAGRRRFAALALIILLALFVCQQSVEARLEFQPLNIPAGEMKLLDLDGDSLKDIVVQTDGALLIFWNIPDTGFRNMPDVTIRAESMLSEVREDFTIADLNGDGLLDVLRIGKARADVFRQGPGRQFSKTPTQTVEFSSTVWFIDLGDVLPDQGIEIVTMGPKGVCAYAQDGAGTYGLAQALFPDTAFLKQIDAEIYTRQWPCPWNFCFDANGDKLDDFFVPDIKAVRLFLQGPRGKFEKQYELRSPVVAEFTTGGVSGGEFNSLGSNEAPYLWAGLQAPSLAARDLNGDGRSDVVLGDVFGFLQKADGTFPEYSDYRAERMPPKDEEDVRVEELVNEFCDVNGDGNMDRVSQYRPWSTGAMKSEVKIFLGNGTRNVYAIDPDREVPDIKVVGSNFLFDAPLVDLDGDGALDILMFDTPYKITEVANWIEVNRGEVRGSVDVYFFDRKKNTFQRRPGYSRKVVLNYEIKTFEIFQAKIFDYVQTMMIVNYDFNGDSLKDLVIRAQSDDQGDLLLIFGNTGKREELFTDQAIANLQTPKFHSYEVMDVNSDKVNDFILYDSSHRRVGILLSYFKKGL
ncbi:MAG: VCBS repeat-containing protein [Candidatus Brocadiia bacterium]